MNPIARLGLTAALALAPACQATPPDSRVNIPAPTGQVEVRIVPVIKVQALDGIVARVHFDLKGANLPAPQTLSIARSQFLNNKATARWDSLLPGPIHLEATLFDSADRVLAVAKGDATVEANKTSKLDLALVPNTGSATFALDAGGLGEPIPALSLAFAGVPAHSWQAAPPLAIPRAGHGVAVVNQHLFTVGGDFNDEVERFDAAAGKWIPLVVPHDPDLKFALGAIGVLRNQIVVVGRDRESGDILEEAAPYFIDPFSLPYQANSGPLGYSRPAPPYPVDLLARRTAAGTATLDDTLYLIGGSSRRTLGGAPYVFLTFNLVEALSGSTARWSQKTPMPSQRGSLGVASLGGKIYAAGGFQWVGTAATDPQSGTVGVDAGGATMLPVANFEAYEPLRDKWTSLAPLPTPRHGLALVASGGRLYALGGAGANGKALATVESYDPNGGTWRAEPPMPTARALVGGATLADGIILAIGGMDSSGRALRTVDAFNPEALP